MLKINTLKYYKLIDKSMSRLFDTINTIECYSPYDQTKDILKSILKSETTTNSTGNIYEVKNKKVNVKEAYLKVFKEYNMDCLLITRLIESLYKVVNLYEQVI